MVVARLSQEKIVDVNINPNWTTVSIGSVLEVRRTGNPFEPSGKVNARTARLCNAYALTKLYQAVLTDNPVEKKRLLDDSSTFSSVSIALEPNAAVQAVNFGVLGKVLYHKELYGPALTALGNGWIQGHKEEWLKDTFILINEKKLPGVNYVIFDSQNWPALPLDKYAMAMIR